MCGVLNLYCVAQLDDWHHDMYILEFVADLVSDRRPTFLHEPDHEVQVAAAFRALEQGVEAEEMAHDLLESGLRIVEAEPDSIAREDVHPLEELVIEDPRLLEDPALLGNIVLRLGHGAYREGLGPA